MVGSVNGGPPGRAGQLGAQVGGGIVDDRAEDLDAGVALEGQLARQERVEDHAQPIHVGERPLKVAPSANWVRFAEGAPIRTVPVPALPGLGHGPMPSFPGLPAWATSVPAAPRP